MCKWNAFFSSAYTNSFNILLTELEIPWPYEQIRRLIMSIACNIVCLSILSMRYMRNHEHVETVLSSFHFFKLICKIKQFFWLWNYFHQLKIICCKIYLKLSKSFQKFHRPNKGYRFCTQRWEANSCISCLHQTFKIFECTIPTFHGE